MDKYQRTKRHRRNKDRIPFGSFPDLDRDTPTGRAIVVPFLMSAIIVFAVLGYCLVKAFVEG